MAGDDVRDDLAEVLERQRLTRDEARPEAIERRRERGGRTARENLADLVDEGSFVEYGSLAIAAQRMRRPQDELIHRTPADGLIAGTARVNTALHGPEGSVLAGSSDIVVATETTALGMGGPAMIEGGGLGTFEPDAIGPISVQTANGVVDVRVADERAAVQQAQRLVSYFQGSVPDWTAPDPAALRDLVPERRRRAYDVRAVVEALADEGTATILREEFARGMVTALVRIEGRAVGVIANNPLHLAGAITSEGADKAARFMQLCDAFGLPILSLVDTPGMMVGPDAEATGLVRHTSRLFTVGASLRVPFVALILRKAYGLGAQAMAGGSLHEPLLTVGWPTAELGAMGLEGAVKLGFRRELEAIADEAERAQRRHPLRARRRDRSGGLPPRDRGNVRSCRPGSELAGASTCADGGQLVGRLPVFGQKQVAPATTVRPAPRRARARGQHGGGVGQRRPLPG